MKDITRISKSFWHLRDFLPINANVISRSERNAVLYSSFFGILMIMVVKVVGFLKFRIISIQKNVL
jgi:hypothetical protein